MISENEGRAKLRDLKVVSMKEIRKMSQLLV